MPDYRNIRFFVAFIGNPRSGTTLVRGLLDAHPRAVVGMEVHVLKHVVDGKEWDWVLDKIVQNSKSFLKNPKHTGYSYKIPGYDSYRHKDIEIIGDKKAALTINLLLENPSLLDLFLEWSAVPVRFIHCVRHPLDVIATRTRKNKDGYPLDFNIQQYFKLERKAAEIVRDVGSEQCKRIYHEDLIRTPRRVLKDMVSFLGLTDDSRYLDACESVIYDTPHQSRFLVKWTPEAIESVERELLHCEHLSYYLDGNRLHFNP